MMKEFDNLIKKEFENLCTSDSVGAARVQDRDLEPILRSWNV